MRKLVFHSATTGFAFFILSCLAQPESKATPAPVDNCGREIAFGPWPNDCQTLNIAPFLAKTENAAATMPAFVPSIDTCGPRIYPDCISASNE